MSLNTVWKRRAIERRNRKPKTVVLVGRNAKFFFDGEMPPLNVSSVGIHQPVKGTFHLSLKLVARKSK